ncbi:CoA transferase subunit A [Haladaptatus halobius]|uniref:CoA transferase subunit A n=1 Tax=Haladaptatus halobius TaxID=2884875 RepID=UPI001D0BAF9E|nr:CoA-transferase [Haladaptatus halobius]
MDKIVNMEEAILDAIEDSQTVYLGGFTHLIPFAAGHEIIRQGYQNLTLARATPDLIYDQMIAAGCASKVVFSWAGNPGVGSLRAFRRAFEDNVPCRISIEEYSHFGLVSRLEAGARNLPFLPLRTFVGSDYPEYVDAIRTVDNPYGDEPDEIPVVPPLNPDVAIVRAQRADEKGSAQLWGIAGDMVEAAFAADIVVLSVEEIVDTEIIQSDPNRTLIPDTVVDYVVEEPYGSHPSYAQGYYDRDNQAYLDWNRQSETHESTLEWLDEWVNGVENRTEYLEKLDTKRFVELQPQSNYATPIDMGGY